jgi:hypothetical protein
MGFTHYWHQPVGTPIPADAWAKIAADARKLVESAPCTLLAEYDEPGTTPEITGSAIWFNGAGGEGHETFFLERTPSGRIYDGEHFSFCKTARKPYDRVVIAILACAAEHAPEHIRVESDGDEEDWRPGLGWASAVLGRPITLPVKADAT